MKKLCSLLLVVALLFGCALAEVKGPVVDEKMTLSVLYNIRDIDSKDPDNYSLKYWEDVTNIHLDIEFVRESDFQTKLTLTFAGNEKLPDVIFTMNPIDAEEYGVIQGYLVPMDEYINPDDMPNLCSLIEMSPSLLDFAASSDGHIYGLPRNYINALTGCNGHNFIHKDWLDTLGLEVPTTVDELTEVLRAFKNEDPNGNGIADEVPYSGTLLDGSNASLYIMFNYWGIPTDGSTFFSLDEEGNVVFDAYRDGFRECLEWLNMLYSEGLIDPETITQDVNTLSSKLREDNIGLFPHFRLVSMNVDPALESCTFMLPVSADGYSAKMNTVASKPNNCFFITKDNEHIEETIHWFDTLLDETVAWNSYDGEYGTMWYYDENGKISYTAPSSDETKAYLGSAGTFIFPSEYFEEKVNYPVHIAEKKVYIDAQYEAGVMQEKYKNGYLSLVSLSAEDQAQINLYKADITKAVKEFVADSIVNGVTDDSWNEFMTACGSLKIDETINIYQPAIDALIK